jgi:hypothetical protein
MTSFRFDGFAVLLIHEENDSLSFRLLQAKREEEIRYAQFVTGAMCDVISNRANTRTGS